MLFPHIKADDAHHIFQDILESCALSVVFICSIDRALYYDWVEVGEHLVFFENHWACPGAIVNSKVEYPFVSCRLANIVQKLFQVFLIFEHILIEVCHLCDTHDLATLLEENRDPNVFRECQKSVKIAKYLLVWSLLVKLLEVLPVTLEWPCFNHTAIAADGARCEIF